MSKKFFKNLFSFFLLIGLVIGFSAAAQGFGVNEVNSGLGGTLAAGDPRTIAGRVINIALGFLGVVAVGLISYAGYLWMTAGGNEEKIDTAKKILKNAAIGLVIILASWGIATFILSKLQSATGGNGSGGCTDGSTISCGCGGTGTMVCYGGSWGSCLAADPEACGSISGPASCDSSPLGGCQAAEGICDPSKYCDPTDCGCKPKGKLGDSCNGSADQGVCSPDNSRCGEYLQCNPDSCKCSGQPVITEISPVGGFCRDNINKACTQDSDCSTVCDLSSPNGAVDNFITIFGKNFGDYSTSSRVLFAASSTPVTGLAPASLNPACIDTWRDDQIVIAVPSGNVSGPIAVQTGEGIDSTADGYGPKISDFQTNGLVRPGLCHLDPNRGALSSAVGYQGINLYLSKAYFGNYENNVRALDSKFTSAGGLSGTSTTPNIRSGDSGSFVQNNIGGQPQNSNYLRFVKEAEPGEGPFISDFYPLSGNTGQYVTIHGKGFGGGQGSNHVYFGDKEATYDFPDQCLGSVWKDDQIIVKVPSGLADGPEAISIKIGSLTIDTSKLNPGYFTFDKNEDLKSSLCKINPERGPIGQEVGLWGEYFGKAGTEGLIKFNSDRTATGTIDKDGRADHIATMVPVGSITGPVHVVYKSAWGNSLDFAVGECSSDAECGTEVCCPSGTYKSGRCAATQAACYVDIPNSVFEWSFNTGFKPTNYSCSGASKYFGSCQSGGSCPNVPGSCSGNAGGTRTAVGDCDHSCAIPGCGIAGQDCQYDDTIDKCVGKGALGSCDLSKSISYTLGGKNGQAAATCNGEGHWEISLNTSCPDGWTKGVNNKCVDLVSSCSICPNGLECEKSASSDTLGRCVSPKLCATGATCAAGFAAGKDKCVVTEQPTCDCCCTIGQDARDCCAPLKCEGTCGADSGKTSGATLGRCGGCASAGNTAQARDAACNCSGHSGQYCEINNPKFPDGVCTDCTGLNSSDCSDHSSACCLDSNKTASTSDDTCRGGNGTALTNDKANPDFGYCAYYKCENPLTGGDPKKCASSTPFKIADYASISECTAECLKGDPCQGIDSLAECQAHTGCCFDAKAAGSAKCRQGAAINTPAGSDNGYCAYYDCVLPTPGNPTVCASSTPIKSGAYSDIDRCDKECANPPSGPGLSCAGPKDSTCSSEVCNFPNFACFAGDGSLGGTASDCGSCCCKPGANDYCAQINPKLTCEANRGSCSGGSRGLCCGCTGDDQCGSKETVGCGLDTCCQARPVIVGTSPAHFATNVCRNSSVRVDFNTLMDVSSFSDNVLLLAEHSYGSGVCPAGTFVAKGDSLQAIIAQRDKSWLARVAENVLALWQGLVGRFSNRATAALPDSSKLYCSVSGTVTGNNEGGTTSLIFTPQGALDPSTNYYFIVKGDEELNSQSGILSAAGVGFNGQGYSNFALPISFTEGENIFFNGRSYKQSQIIKFTTLSGQGATAGLCTVDHIGLTPSSYLFKTTDNSLTENDADPAADNFDSAADGDKVFTAEAYSSDGQILNPVTGYFWDWKFASSDPSIVTFKLAALGRNKVFAAAVPGITDAETSLKATIDMTRFSGSCQGGACSCAGPDCSNSCCNAYLGEDGKNGQAPVYVFVCNNPWPPVSPTGTWSPWVDNCVNAVNPAACSNFDYKFYYCRDAGAAGTYDDLPAIISQAVTRGLDQSPANLVCSSDRSACAAVNAACGPDLDGNGTPEGICVWSVLKESYFFRDQIPTAGKIISAADQQTGGAVKVTWSRTGEAASFKIYYLKSGQGTMQSKSVKVSEACGYATAYCSTIISGLTDGASYAFKVSALSANNVESELSDQLTATPTDNTLPGAPQNLGAAVGDSQLRFNWTLNTDNAQSYRLYHGISSGQYGESFDSAAGASSLVFPLSQFSNGVHYFALSAVSGSKESVKSSEISIDIRSNEIK